MSSPIVVQTHAYLISLRAGESAEGQATQGFERTQQQQSEQQGNTTSSAAMPTIDLVQSETTDEEVGVEATIIDESNNAINSTAATTTGSVNNNANNISESDDHVPSIEHSRTSGTEGTATTEDYSSSPTSSSANSTSTPSTPEPAERTRRDNKLSMLYTPVGKKRRDAASTPKVVNVKSLAIMLSGTNNDADDFIENEHGHDWRKLPRNWAAWMALIVVIVGSLMITTGVVVHNKKKQSIAGQASAYKENNNTLISGGGTSMPTINPLLGGTPTLSPSMASPLNLDTALYNPLGNDDASAVPPPKEGGDENGDIILGDINGVSHEEARNNTNGEEVDLEVASSNVTLVEILPSTNASDLMESVETIPATDTATVTSVTKITYRPGDLTVSMNGLLLSAGLKAEIIAKSGKKVMYSNGKTSKSDFHEAPDFGGTFPAPNGGWIYTSNSEVDKGKGGVGALTFDKDGKITHYQRLLKGSTMNCGGGRTPWGTWISCEEVNLKGQVWEVDPTGREEPAKTVLGGLGGRYESFSYDVRNKSEPHFFVTEDKHNGALRRFTPDPSVINWSKPNKMLHGKGKIEYLVLLPKDGNSNATEGDYTWTSHLKLGRESAMALFPNTEGIDVAGNELFFVSKRNQEMTILDLDTYKYRTISTTGGLFDGKPDQITRITHGEGLLYFTEEGGIDAGVHARDSDGNFYTILESPVWKAETTGLSFSPDGMHMYFAYQANGLLYDVTREDGLPFHGRSINAKAHNHNLHNV